MATRAIRCPECQNPLSVDKSLAGDRITCPKCQRSFRVSVQSKPKPGPQESKPSGPDADSAFAEPAASDLPDDEFDAFDQESDDFDPANWDDSDDDFTDEPSEAACPKDAARPGSRNRIGPGRSPERKARRAKKPKRRKKVKSQSGSIN